MLSSDYVEAGCVQCHTDSMELIAPEFTPATWRAFRRQVLDGMTAAQAAEELGTSVNAALIAKSRVLRRLRREVQGLIDVLG